MHVVGVREGLPRELSLDAVYQTRHVCAEVEVRWMHLPVRSSADRPGLTGRWRGVFKVEDCDLGLAHLTLLLDDTLEVFGGSEVHYEPLRGAAVLPSLPAALFVFDPVLILLAVGHGGAFEGRGVS